jgi:hypothetical protein
MKILLKILWPRPLAAEKHGYPINIHPRGTERSRRSHLITRHAPAHRACAAGGPVCAPGHGLRSLPAAMSLTDVQIVSAVDRSKFRTCAQTTFCKRNRGACPHFALRPCAMPISVRREFLSGCSECQSQSQPLPAAGAGGRAGRLAAIDDRRRPAQADSIEVKQDSAEVVAELKDTECVASRARAGALVTSPRPAQLAAAGAARAQPAGATRQHRAAQGQREEGERGARAEQRHSSCSNTHEHSLCTRAGKCGTCSSTAPFVPAALACGCAAALRERSFIRSLPLVV